jgi:uncharacterized membrane protein
MDYLTAKWLHVLSSTFLFGTGIGSAWYMLWASLTRDAKTVAHTVRHVVWADWLFTATTVVVQPLTGLWMVYLAQIPLTATWILWSFVLYFVAGACWIPVVVIQIRMGRLAEAAATAGTALPAAYFRWLRVWVVLGIPAFVALVVVFWLMVFKPA